MKTRRCLLSFLSILLLLPAVARAQRYTPWSGIISSQRAMDWSQAGIPGGLPDASWPVCKTLSPGVTGAQINTAISSCHSAHPLGGVVVLGSGTFNLNDTGISLLAHTALRGQGANSTFVVFGSGNPGAPTGALISGLGDGTYRGGPNTTKAWTGGYAQGTTQITLGSVSGIAPGSTILILNQCDTGYSGAGCAGSSIDNNGYFQCGTPWTSPGVGCNVAGESADGPSWRSPGYAWQQEEVLVTAINQGGCGANCVTINHPLHHPNWSSGQSPQAVVMQPIIQAGVENLSLDGTAVQGLSTGIGFQNGYEVWVSGSRIVNVYAWSVQLYNCLNSLVQNNYAFGNPSSYGDNTAYHANGGGYDLIVNNISEQKNILWLPDGPCDGCIVAYNAAFNLYAGPASANGNMGSASFAHAGPGNDFTLMEGNYWPRSVYEADHGGHVSMTTFRNFITGWESCVNGNCGTSSSKDSATDAIDHEYGTRYSADIANVLGTPGIHTTYKDNSRFGVGVIYEFGGGYGSQPYDPLSFSTSLLWANWDVVNASTQCNTSEVPTNAPTYPNSVPTLGCSGGALPASFIYSSQPSWWPSSIPYPPIGPDVANGNVGQCGGTLNTTSQAGLAATNASQCPGGSLNLSAWAGHVNANPAMACYFSMGGMPDGTGGILPFNPNKCYLASSSPAADSLPASSAPNPPTNLTINAN
jgi:hypothetical protein